MSSNLADEQTPFLASGGDARNASVKTPLPWGQLWIVLSLNIVEPLAFYMINPFAPQLVRNIGITNGEEAKVGFYVGILHSVFRACQALTILHWGRLSDRVGRRPVLLVGLLGAAVWMYCFGLARQYWFLVLFRGLEGMTNGNSGILKGMVAELTDESNRAQAFSLVTAVFCTGTAVGPVIGGLLSTPSEQYPSIFGHNVFLQQYPYFLPCAVVATFAATMSAIVFSHLNETVALPKWPAIWPSKRGSTRESPSEASYTACSSSTNAVNSNAQSDGELLPMRALLTRPVFMAGASYVILAGIDISMRTVMSLFYATPIEYGGLGLTPPTIGKILCGYGVLCGVSLVLLFTPLHNRLGTKHLYIAGLSSALLVFALFPVLNTVARLQGLSSLVWALIVFQTVISVIIDLCFGCAYMFVAAAAPNRASLGATNGLVQLAVSIMRAIAPTAASSLFSGSIKTNIIGGNLVYVVLVCANCVGILFATFLPRQLWKHY